MKTVLLLSLCCISAFANPFAKKADTCTVDNCQIANNCHCSSVVNPVEDDSDPAPQLLAFTIDESVVQTLYDNYLQPLFFDRTNPDDTPIGVTFYVPHEYTDYSLVQDLYVRGYEIGDHSITKTPNQTYWRDATSQDLIDEFQGQKEILTTFANIPGDDITGVRTPQLQIAGDTSIEAYIAAELGYDNSWPTLSNQRIFPYTLDFASTQKCTVSVKCPTESHQGFWIAPLTNIVGMNGTECNSLATCETSGTADAISDWLFGELDAVKNGNRDPIILRLDTYWFKSVANSMDGFVKFLDRVADLDDVFIVTVQDIIAWMKNPVGVSGYTVPDHSGRVADCMKINCKLQNIAGEDRFMKSCVPCPAQYPWKGNPSGN